MKKTLHKIGFALSALVLTVGMGSCTDWLLVYPEGETLLEDYWKTGADIEKVVAACYRSMQESDWIVNSVVWGELRSDNLTAAETASEDLKSLVDVNILTTNSYTNWAPFYVTINYANTVLHYAPGVMEEDKNLTLSQMNAYRAEALAIRAFSYFYLVRAFRDVPFVTHPTIDDSEGFNLAKTPGHLILDTLIMNLKEAKLYARTSFGASKAHNKGRFTQQSIRALLADIYLWQASGIGTDSLPEAKAREYWEACVKECQEFQDYEAKLPVTAQSYLAEIDYVLQDVFNRGNSPESVFELQYSYDAGLKNSSVTSLYGSSSVKPMAVVTAILNPSNSGVFPMTTTDMRKFYFVRPADGGACNVAKYTCNSVTSTGDGNYTYSTSDQEYLNWVFYRLADINLMKAEALVELSTSSSDPRMEEAIVELNRTYKRANPDMNRNDTLSLSMYSSVEQMRQLVLDERQRELMFEGKRWFDLVRHSRRMNSTEDLKQALYTKFDGSADRTLAFSKLTTQDALYMPINEEEVKNNKLLEQNPFYGLSSNVTTSN
ncbi:MAG: RagB/SusD family nutrient uptake outer membrane protein [Bacteroidales bacterium]|nr:RagB/SusD family nutrient uptake outer membrane protein [Bacteroidales bacterium]